MDLKHEDGAAAIEFALILPILLVLVFGIIEFGLILYYQGVVSSASREGARRGIVVSRPSVTSTVEKYCADMLPSGTPCNFTVESPEGTLAGDPITVTVTYDYTWIVLANFIPGLSTDGQITLTGKTTMYYE